MKKTINIHCDVDASGRLRYRLTKQKGRLSLDEITEAMSEYEIGWYAVIIHCTDDGYQGFMDGRMRATPSNSIPPTSSWRMLNDYQRA